MDAPVALVTGTSTGIGLATAVAAARAGFRVVATVRDTGRADALREAAGQAGVEVDVRALDVTDPDSVRACVDAVLGSYGRLDALVNNAGAGHLGTIELESVDAVREVMEVNFFGVVAMTKTALPHLRATGGRVLTVSSVGGVVGQPFNEAYCAAKFAVEGFMESLAPVAAAVGVHVGIVEPGAVLTAFVASVQAQDAPAVAGTAYEPAFTAYRARTQSAFDPAAAQSAEGVAAVIVDALRDPQPPFRAQSSESAARFVGTKLLDLDGSRVLGATSAWVTAG